LGLATGIGAAGVAPTAHAQVVETQRDTTLTGPRGRTIQRDVTTVRGPGFVDRQVEIKRPGGTLVRDTRVQAMPGGFGGPRPFVPARFGPPRFFGGPTIVENFVVQRPPIVAGFVGLPALSLFFGGGGGGGFGGFGGGAPVPPPPVGAPGVPGPGPANGAHTPPPFDPVTDALGRLKSFHGNSRRDGALTLGRIGDARAVPALCDRLEHDFDKEVRVASAWALGEIGDEHAAVALERAAIHDKRHEVRDAAALAVTKIPKPGQVVDPAATVTSGQVPMTVPPPTLAPSPMAPPAQVPSAVPTRPLQSRPRQPLPPAIPAPPAPAIVTPGQPVDIDPGPVVPPVPNPDDTPPPPPVPTTLPPLEPPAPGDRA
jgi:hypothetical protein